MMLNSGSRAALLACVLTFVPGTLHAEGTSDPGAYQSDPGIYQSMTEPSSGSN